MIEDKIKVLVGNNWALAKIKNIGDLKGGDVYLRLINNKFYIRNFDCMGVQNELKSSPEEGWIVNESNESLDPKEIVLVVEGLLYRKILL